MGLTLLALILTLFLPISQLELTEDYFETEAYSISVSPVQAALGLLRKTDMRKKEIEAFEKNGGKAILEDKDSLTERQILTDVAFKKKQTVNKFIRIENVENALRRYESNFKKALNEIENSNKYTDSEKVIARDELKAAVKTGTEALLALFSYELEYNNSAGLKVFLDNQLYGAYQFEKAKTYLVGEYEWTQDDFEAISDAANVAVFLPEYYDGFKLNSQGEIEYHIQAYTAGMPLAVAFMTLFLFAFTLILLAIHAIFLYRQIKNYNAPLRQTVSMAGTLALIFSITFFSSEESIPLTCALSGAGIAAIAFLALAACAELAYNVFIYYFMRKKFIG